MYLASPTKIQAVPVAEQMFMTAMSEVQLESDVIERLRHPPLPSMSLEATSACNMTLFQLLCLIKWQMQDAMLVQQVQAWFIQMTPVCWEWLWPLLHANGRTHLKSVEQYQAKLLLLPTSAGLPELLLFAPHHRHLHSMVYDCVGNLVPPFHQPSDPAEASQQQATLHVSMDASGMFTLYVPTVTHVFLVPPPKTAAVQPRRKRRRPQPPPPAPALDPLFAEHECGAHPSIPDPEYGTHPSIPDPECGTRLCVAQDSEYGPSEDTDEEAASDADDDCDDNEDRSNVRPSGVPASEIGALRSASLSKEVRLGPVYVCCCCRQTFFAKSVVHCKDAYQASLPANQAMNLLHDVPMHDGKRWLCLTCKRYIDKGAVPPMSVENKMQFPHQPPEIAKLTELEDRLVAPRIPFILLRHLGRGCQLGMVGPVVNVVANTSIMQRVVPRSLGESETVLLGLKRRLRYPTTYMRQNIRPASVQGALRYLVQQPLYVTEGITITSDWTEQVVTDLQREPDLDTCWIPQPLRHKPSLHLQQPPSPPRVHPQPPQPPPMSPRQYPPHTCKALSTHSNTLVQSKHHLRLPGMAMACKAPTLPPLHHTN